MVVPLVESIVEELGLDGTPNLRCLPMARFLVRLRFVAIVSIATLEQSKHAPEVYSSVDRSILTAENAITRYSPTFCGGVDAVGLFFTSPYARPALDD